MFKRTLTFALVAIFVATGALAATVQTSSAYDMHHHHHYYDDDYGDYWWYHHRHHHHHGRVVIIL
ncbi:hypothetical protein ACVDG8_001275 [Mesorhizobium sp. ORM8.1]